MVTINLLPWRAMAREENQKERKLFFNAISILIFVGILIHIGFSWTLQSMDNHIADLQNQLTELKSQTQQNQMNPSSLITEQIHSCQVELIYFFKTFFEVIQEKISWSEMIGENNHINITGNIDSFLILAKMVGFYNEANKRLPMNVLSVKDKGDASAVAFRLGLMRADSPFLRQTNDDSNS